MLELELATALFRDALLETKVYRKYVETKEAVKQDERLWQSLQIYRQKRHELQQQSGADELYEKLDEIEREERKFRSDARVAAFLDAELALCRMMQEIFLTMVDSLDFE